MALLGLAENTIQLVPDGTLGLHVVLVLAMVGLLRLTLYAPITRVLEERERLGKMGVGQANEVFIRVEEKTSAYERAMGDARKEGYAFVEEERADAIKRKNKRLAAVKEEISAWTVEQLQEIYRQVAETRATLQAESAKSALRICTRVLRLRDSGRGEVDSEE